MKAKKVLLLTAAAVLIYTLIAHPTQLGDGVQTIFSWIGEGLNSIVAFFKSTVD
jgi:Flp pilus assembly pilin Flp